MEALQRCSTSPLNMCGLLIRAPPSTRMGPATVKRCACLCAHPTDVKIATCTAGGCVPCQGKHRRRRSYCPVCYPQPHLERVCCRCHEQLNCPVLSPWPRWQSDLGLCHSAGTSPHTHKILLFGSWRLSPTTLTVKSYTVLQWPVWKPREAHCSATNHSMLFQDSNCNMSCSRDFCACQMMLIHTSYRSTRQMDVMLGAASDNRSQTSDQSLGVHD